jgi:hypothetical protein
MPLAWQKVSPIAPAWETKLIATDCHDIADIAAITKIAAITANSMAPQHAGP